MESNRQVIIVNDSSDVGYMKFSRIPGNNILSTGNFPFDAVSIPEVLSPSSIENSYFEVTPKEEPWFKDNVISFLSYDWSQYQRVTVWTNDTLGSKIMAMFIAKIYDGDLYLFDYSSMPHKLDFATMLDRNFEPESVLAMVGKEILCTEEYKESLRDCWDELAADGRALKVLDENGRIVCRESSELLYMLDGLIPDEGISIGGLIGKLLQVSPINSLSFFDRLVMDSIRNGVLCAYWKNSGERISGADVPSAISCSYNIDREFDEVTRPFSYRTVLVKMAA